MKYFEAAARGTLGRLSLALVCAVAAGSPTAVCRADDALKVLWQTTHFTEGDHNFVSSTELPPLAFSGDSKWLAVGRGHDVVVHETETGRVVASTNSDELAKTLNGGFAQERFTGRMAFSPDGAVLATTIAGGRRVDGRTMAEIFLWETSSGRFVGSLPGHRGTEIGGLFFSTIQGDSTLRLLSLGRDGYNRLWNVTRREEVFAFEAPRTAGSLGNPNYRNGGSAFFTGDGKILITAARYEIASRNAVDGVVFSRYCVSENSSAETFRFAASNDGKYVLLSGDVRGAQLVPGVLSLVDLRKRESRVIAPGRQVTLANFGQASSRLFLLIEDAVECYEATDLSVVYSTKVSSGDARQLAISANESTLGIVGPDKSIRCFAVERTGLKLLGNTPKGARFDWLQISPDGKYVAGSSSDSGEVMICEVPRP